MTLDADFLALLVRSGEGAPSVIRLRIDRATAELVTGLVVLHRNASAARREPALVVREKPTTLLLLGDSFHDRGGPERLPADEFLALQRLCERFDLLWIEGNHDPGTWPLVLGRPAAEFMLGPLLFRHEALPGPVAGEVSGHFHPRAAVRHSAGRVGVRCFVTDGRHLILPAFGSLTGGLDVPDPVYRPLFPEGFAVVILGERRAARFPARLLA